QDAVERAELISGNHLLVIAKTMRGAAAAYEGREADARADAQAALDVAARCGPPVLAFWPLCLLGFLEVSLGNNAAALTALQPLCNYFETMRGTEIMTGASVPEGVEAMIGLHRLDEAEPMIKALKHNGRQLDRPWMLAIGGRCRGMKLAAQGD